MIRPEALLVIQSVWLDLPGVADVGTLPTYRAMFRRWEYA